MEHPLWMWIAFLSVILALLAFDLGVLHRKEREIKVAESLKLVAFYFSLAMLFNLWVFFNIGKQAGYEFLMGYLVEQSLSLDNLFVFVLIFAHFGVPRQYQHRVLFWGIIGAIFFRACAIFGGTALIHAFSDILYLFGALLVYTGIKMLAAADSEPDVANNRIVQFMHRRFRVTREFRGNRFFVREGGKLWMTPLFTVLILVEISDIVFAVDSLPAIFAITQDPFIILTSNIFAILGLRAMFFALSAFIYRFEFLKYGLSVILVMIGCKMLVNHHFGEKIIATEISLALTVLILVVSVIVSLHKTRGQAAPAPEHTQGWVPGSPAKSEVKED